MWYSSKLSALCVCFCVWYASICDSVVFLCLSMYDEHLYTGQCCVHGAVVFMYLFLSGYCYASVCDNGVFVCVCFQGEVHMKALAICHQINTSASPFRPSESQYFLVFQCLMILFCKFSCICT